MAEGWLPAGEVNVRFRATLPLAAAVPEERARVSGPAWPTDTRVERSEASAKINAIWPGVEDLLFESFV